MPICRDPLVAMLNSWGFNALRCPRMDYLPASVLTRTRNSRISFFGAWAEAFTAPEVPVSHQASGMQYDGQTTGRYRSHIGLKLLTDWLGAVTGNLSSAVAGSHRLSFQLRDTRVMTISPAALSNALASAEPTDGLLDVSETRMFLLTDALQVKELVMVVEKEGTSAATMSVEAMPAVPAAGPRGTVETNFDRASEGLVRFRCEKFHTIGYKVCEVEIADGAFRLSPSNRPVFGVQMSNAEERYEPVVFEPEPL